MTLEPKIQVFDSEQYAQDLENITDPVLRRNLIEQLSILVSELETSGQPASSRELTTMAGWPGFQFVYLEKPYGLVYKFEEGNLYLGRIAPVGEILHF